ncbi:hypothetical protein M0R72_14625 [Candidatus Pacearchaeota archaeon]|jgi:hypothetical protein|nr:hypothetical protein [Candidatus Pacearchaeota archaeon]
MYRFHRCNTDPRFPDLQDWRIEIRPDDPETLEKIHRGVAAAYLARFSQDPHLKDNPNYHWLKLGAQWLQTAEKLLWEGPIVVNINGGTLLLSEVVVLETVETAEIDFNVRFENEVITISRWPEGKHFWLASNKYRIFVPDKHNTYAAARKHALHYVPAERIKGNC